MSKNPYQRFDDINDLIQDHGETGIRALLMFKLLKDKVMSKLAQSSYPSISEKLINRICMEKALQLSKLKTEMPSEEDIQELLSKLKHSQQSL